MDQLMQKLMMSKAIMDKSDQIKRGNGPSISLPSVNVESFDTPQAKYNIPQEFVSESNFKQTPKQTKIPTVDAIKNSKLPDEIKRLMIEHPIQQMSSQGPTLSDELVEKASRLMKEQGFNTQPQKISEQKNTANSGDLQKMIESAVRKVLKENGLISESEEKTNEIFSFKVGKHVFEGKVTKIKKIP